MQRDLKTPAITFGIWTIVNVWYGTIPTVVRWVFRPWTGANSIIPLSILWSLVTFAYAFHRLRLGAATRVLLALSVPFAFLGTFETLYQHLFLVANSARFATDSPGELMLASWILLGITTVPYWKWTRAASGAVGLLTVTFGLWLFLGYHQIYEVNNSIWVAYIFNTVAKSLTAILFLVLLHGGTQKLRRRGDKAAALTLQSSPSVRVFAPQGEVSVRFVEEVVVSASDCK